MHCIDNNFIKYETQIHFGQSADAVGFEINGVFCSSAKMNAAVVYVMHMWELEQVDIVISVIRNNQVLLVLVSGCL